MQRALIVVVVIVLSALAFFGDENVKGTNWGETPTDETSISQVVIASEQGDKDSQELLGKMYRDGISVGQDYNKALYWFKEAGDKRDIAWMHHKGLGVVQDSTLLLLSYLSIMLVAIGALFLCTADWWGAVILVIGLLMLYIPSGLPIVLTVLLFFLIYTILDRLTQLVKKPRRRI